MPSAQTSEPRVGHFGVLQLRILQRASSLIGDKPKLSTSSPVVFTVVVTNMTHTV